MLNATQPGAIDILAEIPANGARPPQPDTTTLDSSPYSATDALYRAAIGPINTNFYQRVFGRLEDAGRLTPTWNWAAALLTVNWLVFRQLWVAAVVYLGLIVIGLVLILGLGRLAFQWPSELEIGSLVLMALAAVLVPGVYGNALLHWASRKKMAQALAANTSVTEACAMLERQASTKQRLIWIALANALVVGAAVGITVALPDADPMPLSTPTPTPPRNVAAAPILGAVAIPISAASAPEVPASASALPTASQPAPVPEIASLPASVTLTSPVSAVPIASTAPATPTTQTESKPTEKPRTKDALTDKKIYINVGLFAQESNARNARNKLVNAGLPVIEQQVSGTKGTFTRIRVGPYKTPAQAEKAVEKIKGQGLEAVVTKQ